MTLAGVYTTRGNYSERLNEFSVLLRSGWTESEDGDLGTVPCLPTQLSSLLVVRTLLSQYVPL